MTVKIKRNYSQRHSLQGKIDPLGTMINEEIVDFSYGVIQSNSLSRAQCENDDFESEEENDEYKKYSAFVPLHQDKALISILKPSAGCTSKLKLPTSALPPLPTLNFEKLKRQITKQDQYNPAAKRIKQEVIDNSYQAFEYASSKFITGDKTIVRNGRSRISKNNFRKKVLEAYSEKTENSSVAITSAEPENAAPAAPPIQVMEMDQSAGSSLITSENQEIDVTKNHAEDQYNPAAKRIKQEVIDNSYQPFEYASSKFDQYNPSAKRIKQEVIDNSYQPFEYASSKFRCFADGNMLTNLWQEMIYRWDIYLTTSLSRAESDSEEENDEYKEISKNMPLRTLHKDKALASILKPPTTSISKDYSAFYQSNIMKESQNSNNIQVI